MLTAIYFLLHCSEANCFFKTDSRITLHLRVATVSKQHQHTHAYYGGKVTFPCDFHWRRERLRTNHLGFLLE